jgi:hypothetical protein
MLASIMADMGASLVGLVGIIDRGMAVLDKGATLRANAHLHQLCNTRSQGFQASAKDQREVYSALGYEREWCPPVWTIMVERVDLDDSPVLRSFFARLPLVDLAETTFFYERLKEQLPRRGVSRPAASCNRLQKVFKQVTVC